MSERSTKSEAAAADYFKQAIRAGSIDASDFEQLATIQAKSGRAQDAIATVERGMKVTPAPALPAARRAVRFRQSLRRRP